MSVLAAAGGDVPVAFIELGAVAFGLAILARLAGRLGIPAIPFYLVAGLAIGEGGVAPLDVSEGFISLAAQIGVLLLLLTLGLEYTGDELRHGLRTGTPAGLARHGFELHAGPGLRPAPRLGVGPGDPAWRGVLGQLLGGRRKDPGRPRLDGQPRNPGGIEPSGHRRSRHGGLPARRRGARRGAGLRRDGGHRRPPPSWR